MDIIIFGVGDIYRKNKKYIAEEDNIKAFFDNNIQLQGKELNGIRIYSPVDINKISYDKIVIMSHYFAAMKKQLLELNCVEEDIIYYPEYISQQYAGKMNIYFGVNIKSGKKKGLIITSSLDYHGGAIAGIYMALALQTKGYEVVVAAPEASEDFIKEFQKKGITFLVYPNLKFAKYEELFWTKPFQMIVVNTYPMILCALEISAYRRVMVWLHESDVVYRSMDYWRELVRNCIPTANISFYAVSDVGRINFEKNIAKCNMGILPYGIPDVKMGDIKTNKDLRFAIVGSIFPLKNQLLFLDAVEGLSEAERLENNFLIIGDEVGESDYVAKVKEKAEALSHVQIVGKLTRKEIEHVYKRIDVFVIASEQETMSLIATEAMMCGKVCILCDVAGMAGFIKHGENGLLFETGNTADLTKQIRFCINNRKDLLVMGKNARKTYEKYFTMKKFGDKLEGIMCAETMPVSL